MLKFAVVGALAAGLAASSSAGAAETGDSPYAATLFAGVLLNNDFDEVVVPTEIEVEGFGLVGAALSARMWRPIEGLDIEVEGQLVRHVGVQTHWTVNAPVVARWTAFPWDETVDTSAAFGLGLSAASEEPRLERRNEDETEAVMAYWMVELELGPPDSAWSGVGRLHHRSTAFGAFGDDGGSNALVLGLRRRL